MAEEILKERNKLKDFYIIGAKYIAHNCYQEMTKRAKNILDYELENLKEIQNAHTKWKISEVENEIGREIILTEDLELHIIEIP